MSYWISKSALNYSAAELLHKESHYCSVIHCSYYSSVQLMLHILNIKIGKTESKAKIDAGTTTKGSHEILISEIATYINAVNKRELAVFNNHIGKLKQLRRKADYEDIGITFEESRNSILVAETVNKVLKKAI